MKFVLMPGPRHDTKGVKELIVDVRFDALVADKAFDVNWLMPGVGQARRTGGDLANAAKESAAGD